MQTPPATMRAVTQSAPGAALELHERPMPQPGPDDVLVKIAASPINPSDLAMLQGSYGISFDYPMIPGLEGSGQVVATGPGLMPRLLAGKPVACVAGAQGLWAEYAVIPASQCLPLPPEIPLGPGAMAMVNPLTAYAFGRIADAKRHRALVSTAAAGQLGAMIRKACRRRGIKVINIVRSEAQRDALAAQNAIALNMNAPGFEAELKAECKRLRCRLALDAVGGQMTFQLVEAMPPKSEVLIYGGLAQEASRLNPGTMIFREARVEGFWLTKWLARKTLPEKLWIMRQVTLGLKGGFATSHVAHVVGLEAAPDAPAGYMGDMSAGKWLIAPGGTEGLGL